jgi:hypothetical protein
MPELIIEVSFEIFTHKIILFRSLNNKSEADSSNIQSLRLKVTLGI